jgi:hypothetical protein
MIFYTNFLIPSRFAGYTIGPIILIRPSYRDDIGLLAHEKVHVRQFLDPRWWFRSQLDREVAAYKVQAACYSDDRIPLFAGYIATKYGLGINATNAERMLRA